MQVEQRFENLVDWLRCSVHEESRVLQYFSVYKVEVTRHDLKPPIVGHGQAPTKKAARRHAIMAVMPRIWVLSDPCKFELGWVELWHHRLKKPVVAFERPPAWWFEQPQVLGVDWEGSPPVLVQVACEAGVYIDRTSALLAKSILADKRHIHCVFGAHEVHMCANGVDVQESKRIGLAEQVSRAWCPQVRLVKNRPTDVAWDVPPLPPRALEYAAMDAEVTRRFGLRLKLC